MIGKTHIRAKTTVWETVLSYTTLARPLSVEQIHDDIDVLHRENKFPEKIEMWEYQWDWITKGVDNSGGYLYGERDLRIGYKSVFGIPVTVLK